MKIKVLGVLTGLRSPEENDCVKAMLNKVCQASGLAVLEEVSYDDRKLPVLSMARDGQTVFQRVVWDHAIHGFSIGWQEESNGSFSILCDPAVFYWREEQHSHLDNSKVFSWREEKASRYIKLIQAAFLLLCEHLFPNQLLCYDDDALDETGSAPLVIPALRWLKHLFPEEIFEDILTVRTSPNLSNWIQKHLAKENELEKAYYIYVKTALFQDTTTHIRYLYDLYSRSMEEDDTEAMMASPEKIYKLDCIHPLERRGGTSVALLALCLNKDLRKNFFFDGASPEEAVRQAAHSLNLLRNGSGPAAMQEWGKYCFPGQAALRFYTMEWEGLVKVLSYLSGLPEKQVWGLIEDVSPQHEKESRLCLQAAVCLAQKEELIRQCAKPMDGETYFDQKYTDSCYFWGMDRALIEGIPSYNMFCTYREEYTLAGNGYPDVQELYSLVECIAKEGIYMTKNLLSLLLRGILEKEAAICAAAQTLKELGRREKYSSVLEFLSFLENTELRRRCMGF